MQKLITNTSAFTNRDIPDFKISAVLFSENLKRVRACRVFFFQKENGGNKMKYIGIPMGFIHLFPMEYK